MNVLITKNEVKKARLMPNIIMPQEKYNPICRKMKEMRKVKALQWAKRHGCYEEVKKYYEVTEWLEIQIVH